MRNAPNSDPNGPQDAIKDSTGELSARAHMQLSASRDKTRVRKTFMEDNLAAILRLSHARHSSYLDAKQLLLKALVDSPDRLFALLCRKDAEDEIERINQEFLRRRILGETHDGRIGGNHKALMACECRLTKGIPATALRVSLEGIFWRGMRIVSQQTASESALLVRNKHCRVRPSEEKIMDALERGSYADKVRYIVWKSNATPGKDGVLWNIRVSFWDIFPEK